MTVKDAKEYLSKAYRIDQRINAKLEQTSSLRTQAEKATTTFSDMPKSFGDVHSREKIIVKIIDLEHEINADIDSLVDLKAEMISKIKSIPCIEHQMLLELRYICFKPWEDIAEDMNFSLQHIFRLHSAALQNFSKIFEDESKWD